MSRSPAEGGKFPHPPRLQSNRRVVEVRMVNADRQSCFEARHQLRSMIDRYCAHHGIDPPYQITAVFDRRRVVGAGRAPGEVLAIPRSRLIDLDDDDAWVEVCPADRRWWDLDLYPQLAAEHGVVGFTASPERADEPTTTPGGIFIHRDPAELR